MVGTVVLKARLNAGMPNKSRNKNRGDRQQEKDTISENPDDNCAAFIGTNDTRVRLDPEIIGNSSDNKDGFDEYREVCVFRIKPQTYRNGVCTKKMVAVTRKEIQYDMANEQGQCH